MRSNEDIERYLIQMNVPFEAASDGVWILSGEQPRIVIAHMPPVVVFRLKVANLPKGPNEALFRALLELNAKEMIHGAFGIEDGCVVIAEALESENLDMNEFEAAVDSVSMAVQNHYHALAKFLQPEGA